ncbi:MAG: hypothetical protein H6673_15735 [Anaerolineales bacterium]|nr:hypothetical protein [Anaerolineales bacterium]
MKLIFKPMTHLLSKILGWFDRLWGSGESTELQIHRRITQTLITALDEALDKKTLDDEALMRLKQDFSEQIQEQHIISDDNHRSDIVVTLRDRTYIFEVKVAYLNQGELGPEILGPSELLKRAAESYLGMETQVIFVSPKGASRFVTSELHQKSGSTVISAEPKSLDELCAVIAREFLADEQPEYSPELLYHSKLPSTDLSSLEYDFLQQIVNQGQSRHTELMAKDVVWRDVISALSGEHKKLELWAKANDAFDTLSE